MVSSVMLVLTINCRACKGQHLSTQINMAYTDGKLSFINIWYAKLQFVDILFACKIEVYIPFASLPPCNLIRDTQRSLFVGEVLFKM